MTPTQFNEKYADHLAEGHYGMSIPDPDVIQYLDQEFAKEVEENPDFKYYQVKVKFHCSRVYTNSGRDKESVWEKGIDSILKAKS